MKSGLIAIEGGAEGQSFMSAKSNAKVFKRLGFCREYMRFRAFMSEINFLNYTFFLLLVCHNFKLIQLIVRFVILDKCQREPEFSKFNFDIAAPNVLKKFNF